MFDAKSIRRGIQKSPRKVVLYGEPKVGKTILAASAQKSLLIAFEDRVSHVPCDKTEIIKSYSELMEVFEFLLSDTNYQTVICDTLDWLEPLLHDQVCKDKGFKSLISDTDGNVNYGRGMKYHAVEGWKSFLNDCDRLREEGGKSIVLISHAENQKVSPPDLEPYERWNLKIDKHAAAVVSEWADVIGFYNREVLVTKQDEGFGKKKGKAIQVDDTRILNLTASNPAWVSGNSYGLNDITVELDKTSEIMDYILDTDIMAETPKTKIKKEVK